MKTVKLILATANLILAVVFYWYLVHILSPIWNQGIGSLTVSHAVKAFLIWYCCSFLDSVLKALNKEDE